MMEDQRELADFIKGVHRSLRQKALQLGFEAAWEEHKHDQSVLKKYAESMKALATEFWDKRNPESGKCRIQWVINECISYFYGGGWEKGNTKEIKLLNRLNSKTDTALAPVLPNTCLEGKIRLLDVGSCYNPFKEYPQFQVTAIDIAPAVPDVIKCDFLKSDVIPSVDFNWESKTYETLPEGSFDVVVFSLFLEYLPEPSERFTACQKGVQLLKKGGLLTVVTPDSNHESSNSRLMKEWKEELSHLGLLRLSLVKLEHVRCMSFRKCFEGVAPLGGASGVLPKRRLFIPQDKTELASPSPPPCTEKSDPDNNNCVAELFTLLANDVSVFD